MRISELAALAGVTVRTIRHYHQQGVLPEPARSPNGYREYSGDDLVMVLRIRHLLASGMTLAHASRVIAGSSDDMEAVLDEIDQSLDRQIRDLMAQRARLAEARAGRHLGASRLAAALTVSPGDAQAAILVAHLLETGHSPEDMIRTLQDPDYRARLIELQQRFEAIDETADEAEVDQLIEDIRGATDVLAQAVPDIADDHAHLIQAYAERDLHPRQLELFRRISSGERSTVPTASTAEGAS